VVVVGSGPSGLVTCKSLLDAASPDFPFDPIILEQESDIGGTFRYRSYEVSRIDLFDIVLMLNLTRPHI
jgi:dimethylaniline monooxygenase (N-oxide forming)